MTTAIPFFGDTVSICTMVWTVVSNFQDAPEAFKNYSIHVRQVGDTVKRLEKQERETQFFKDLDEDSKNGLIDKLSELNEALKPMRKIQTDYKDIERISEKRKKEQNNAQSGKSLPQEREKKEGLMRRKWQQTKFSLFKLDEIASCQTNLDRHLMGLTLFLEGENLAINLESRKILRELEASRQAALFAPPPTPQPAVPTPASRITLRPREKISCLFVDSTNTEVSVAAQAYAELIKLWTLDNIADSPFGTISSAGLHVRSSLITPSLFPTVDLSSPGQTPSHSAITALFPGDRETDEMCNASFVGSRCSEVRRVKARTYAHVSRGICAKDFMKFDLIVACSEEIFLELEELKDVVTQMAASKPGEILPSAKLRLVRTPQLMDDGVEILMRENMEGKMVGFTMDETSWWSRPTRKMGLRQETKCAFRTRQAVVGMRHNDLTGKVGNLEGVFVFAEPIDGKDTEESLLTVTGKYGKMDSAFQVLEKKLPMRKF